jgi:hypothetical protein
LFEVLDHGRRQFAFVLADNHYNLAISSEKARRLPLALVQISSDLIHSRGIEAIDEELWPMMLALSHDVDDPRISRVDLYVDFIPSWDLTEIHDEQWITSAKRIDRYRLDGQVSGWGFGKGLITARLYDKTREIQVSKKFHLEQAWHSAGWEPGQTVWRLEFQFRREFLKQFGIHHISQLLDQSGMLWRYASHDWLKLAVPNETDSNRSRWPTLATWAQLSNIDWGDASPPTRARVPQERLPSDETLFSRGLWPLTSFMAREGILDLQEALDAFLRKATRYHAMVKKQDLNDYLLGKVAQKGKRYNTLRSPLLPDPKDDENPKPF